MSTLPILIAPDSRLKLRAKPVRRVDQAVQHLMDDMLETMYAQPGIGLAAPQVGESLRVIVIDVSHGGEKKSPIKMANPKIIWASESLRAQDEGCLSFPEHFVEVTRPDAIRVQYVDEFNKSQELEAEGILSTCIQHEIDHLDGILFVDHISALRRKIIIRKLIKLKKSR